MLSKRMVLLLAIACLGLSVSAGAQQTALPQICPSGPPNGAVSPDKQWAIFGSPTAGVWIVNEKTNRRRFLLLCPDTVQASWAPDGKRFVLNDQKASDEGYAYVYDPRTLKVTDLGKLIAAADPQAIKYLHAGHHYVMARRWITSSELLVRLSGHFDYPPAYHFALYYKVSPSGAVSKISQHVGPPTY